MKIFKKILLALFIVNTLFTINTFAAFRQKLDRRKRSFRGREQEFDRTMLSTQLSQRSRTNRLQKRRCSALQEIKQQKEQIKQRIRELNPENAEIIFDIIEKNPLQLKLKNLQITDEQLDLLVHLIPYPTSIYLIDLSDNQLTNLQGFEMFTNLGILALCNNQLQSLKGITKIEKLSHLNLENNSQISFKEAANLTKLPNLQRLRITLNFNSEKIKRFFPCKRSQKQRERKGRLKRL